MSEVPQLLLLQSCDGLVSVGLLLFTASAAALRSTLGAIQQTRRTGFQLTAGCVSVVEEDLKQQVAFVDGRHTLSVLSLECPVKHAYRTGEVV